MSGSGVAQWDGAAYVEGSGHHRAYDDYILSPLRLVPGMRVVDVGCGTGELTATVAARVAPGDVIGIEPDESQVAMARRHRDIEVRQGRAQELSALVTGRVDVVLSVAALHWVELTDHRDILRQMGELLGSGGQLRLDLGGQGQIAAARAVLEPIAEAHDGRSPWTFPTVEDYAPLLADAGFELDTGWLRLVTQTRAFPDQQSFLAWLRSQIINGYASTMPTDRRESFAAAAEAAALGQLRLPDGSFDQTYVRLDVLARRG